METIKKETLKDIALLKAEIKAWGSVKIKTKKDGSDFKHLTQAVEGATISGDKYNPKLRVFFHVDGVGHSSSTLDAYIFIKDLPENDFRNDGVTSKNGLYTTTLKTSEELKETISKSIEKKQEYLKGLEDNVSKIEEAFITYKKDILDASNKLRELVGNSTLYSQIVDRVRRGY